MSAKDHAVIYRVGAPLALAAALALIPIEAARAQATCLTEPEVAAMAGFALPTLIQGVLATCKPSLAPAGYLSVQGPGLVSRYADRKALAWPAAKAAFFKLGNEDDPDTMRVLTRMPDTALQPLVEGIVGQMATKKLDPGTCRMIERGTELLAPLPPENTANLIGFVVALASSKPGSDKQDGAKPKRKMDFRICPAAN